MSTDLTTLLQDLLRRLFSDPVAAEHFAQDPHGTLAAQGITDHDLSTVNMPQVVEQVAATAPLPHETRVELQQYATDHHVSHSSGHHDGSPIDHIISQVQQVQEIVHNESYHYNSYDESVHNTVDNSIDVNGDGNTVEGGTNTTAIGDHPVAVGGDLDGQVNTGDGAVQAGGDIDGPVNTGSGVASDGPVNTGAGGVATEGGSGPINTGDGGVALDGPNSGVINTGTNTGIQAGGDVHDGIVGNGNTAVHTGNLDHSPLNFGSGSATDVDLHGSTFGQGATVGVGGSTSGSTINENSGNTYDSNNHTDSHDHTNVHESFDSHDQVDSNNDSHDHVTEDSNNHYSEDSHDHYKSDSHDHEDSDNDSHDHTDVHEHVDI